MDDSPRDDRPTRAAGPVTLPQWMRDPGDVPATRRHRLSRWLDGQPALAALRRGLRRWWDRPTLTERYPRAMPIVSFVLVAAVATILISGALYVFGKLRNGQPPW